MLVWGAVVVGILSSTFGQFQSSTPSSKSQKHCAVRKQGSCCPGRDDSCTMPIRNTLCYCDVWCYQHKWEDCCPDFEPTCLPSTTSSAQPLSQDDNNCLDGDIQRDEGSTKKLNCNICKCMNKTKEDTNILEWSCTNDPCIVEDPLVDNINDSGAGWSAKKYQQFLGIKLDVGVRHFLGTRRPDVSVASMYPVNIDYLDDIPTLFDARVNWPGYIHPARDQGQCGTDWAFAATDVLADRLSILSKGAFTKALSVQHLLSCDERNNHHCGDRGRVEDAFWFINKMGIVSEECYPYESGNISVIQRCKLKKAVGTGIWMCPTSRSATRMYTGTPPYRISGNERDIMKEISSHGPVLAIMKVAPDFYLYKDGVYRNTGFAERETEHAHTNSGYHSVRIIGWGEESGYKYWLVVNSWGRNWGIDGTFKILRGSNESEIESFVVGVWGKVETGHLSSSARWRNRQ